MQVCHCLFLVLIVWGCRMGRAAGAQECKDDIGYGMTCQMLPNFCSSKYAPLLCRRSCKFCNASTPAQDPTDSATYPPWTETCLDHVTGVLTCPVIPNVCDDAYGRLFCRKNCGICLPATTTTAATTTTTTMTTVPQTTAAKKDNCKDDIGYGMTCQMLPNFCSSKYAPLLCRRSCKFCNASTPAQDPTDSATYPPWTETCLDHVTGVLTCPVIPNVCDDAYGRLFCRKNCGICLPATTTTANPSSGTAAASSHHPHYGTPHHPHGGTETTTPVTIETCLDNLGNGLSCVEVAQICPHPFGPVVCPRSCRACQPTPNAVTPSEPSTPSLPLGSCTDHVMRGATCAELPNVCSDQYGQIICSRFCGLCGGTTAATSAPAYNTTAAIVTSVTSGATSPLQSVVTSGSTSVGSSPLPSHPGGVGGEKTTLGQIHVTTTPVLHWAKCMDHIGNGRTCASYPGFCQDAYSSLLCPKFCGMCVPLMDTATFAPDTTTSSPAGSCVDRVTNGLTCRQIPNVCDDPFGRQICALTCSACGGVVQTGAPTTAQRPSTPHPSLTTSTLTSVGDCEDKVGLGLTCDGLPGACNDPLAAIICRKTCGFCDCQDKIVGMTCQDLIVKYDRDPCRDALGHQVCARFCGFC